MKKDPRIVRKVSFGRGQWAIDLGNCQWVGYGYSWSSPNQSAFCPANPIGNSVSVYLTVERDMKQKDVLRVVVGQARRAAQASKIGRKAVREMVLPMLSEAIEACLKK